MSNEKHTIRIITNHPVAEDSPDHLAPLGCVNDNTTTPHYTAWVCNMIGKSGKYLDLGCAGGGAVMDVARAGVSLSMGLEGSTHPRNAPQAAGHENWTRYEGTNLFTCDISKPFAIVNDRGPLLTFDLISAWELLEHLKEHDVAKFMKNVWSHLAPGGYFIASICPNLCHGSGMFGLGDGNEHHRHQTVRPLSYWREIILKDYERYEIPAEKVISRKQFLRNVGNDDDVYVLQKPNSANKLADLVLGWDWDKVWEEETS